MKKYIYLFSILFLSASISTAQGIEVEPESTGPIAFDANVTEHVEYAKVYNRSAVDKIVQVERTVNNLSSGQSTYFCWDNCFSPSVSLSGNLTVPANGSLDIFSVHFVPDGNADRAEITFVFTNVDNPGDRQEVTFVFDNNPSTSIDEFDAVNALRGPFPNPASDHFKLMYELPTGIMKAELKIYNLIGRQIRQLDVDGFEDEITVDANGMTPGVYFVYLTAEGKELTSRKLVISK
ncbi:MAG: T9SS type A sorting domain-containing protein [Bacteroidota bacterium]